MTTILRSSKYIRCLNGFAQRIIGAHDKSKFATKSIAIEARCINSYLTKSYATIPATQHKETAANYDDIFRALDTKIQRHGRVFYDEVEDVLCQIRNTGDIPSLQALLLIRCCGDLLVDNKPEERNQLVQEIWSTLRILKIPMDISHFNALLKVYLENDHNFSPIDFLTDLKENGIEPNRITYQRLILQYCKRGDIEGATKILEFMKHKRIPLNESIFNALITGHSEANDMENAKNVLNLMREVDIEPSVRTYSALLCAYAKRGDIESIRNSFKEISAKDMSLQDKDYLDIIHVLATNGHENQVDEILSMISIGQNYNIDAVHAILKVLDGGNMNVALKILGTMQRRSMRHNEEKSSSGTFLIQKLVNSKYPAEKIVKACAELEQQGQHTYAFNVAVERALENGNIELGTELLKGWKQHGGTLREHYFWPLIIARGKSSNCQGIYDVLQLMVNEFNVIPSFETIKDYVLPYTVGKWEETVSTITQFHVPRATIVSAIANRLLIDKKINKAARFMMSYPIAHVAESFYRSLAEALDFTGDAKSFVMILRLMYDTTVHVHEESGDDKIALPPKTVVDDALRIMLDILPNMKAPCVEDVLTNLVEAGLSITPELGDTIRKYFQENATPETYAKIDKLTSGNLELAPLSTFNTCYMSDGADVSDSHHLGKSKMMFSVRNRQLIDALKTRNIESINTAINDLESIKWVFSSAACAQIIEVACSTRNLEMAEMWVNKLKNKRPNQQLKLNKCVQYADLLIRNDRFDDALKFVLEWPRMKSQKDFQLSPRRSIKRLLDTAARTGNVAKTNQLFDALLKSNYATLDSFMLSPLIAVHLIRNDLDGALEAFERACLTQQCTPLKYRLLKTFIEREDANSLERITNLSTQIHGASNSLIDLSLSFVECGRFRQARKILETPGLRFDTQKLKNFAVRYLVEDKPESLTQFIELTKNLPVVNRQKLYDVLLETYNEVNNWQRGLSLWTEIQDENVQPNDTFLTTLASLLIRNNQSVPFVYNKHAATGRLQLKSDDYNDFEKALKEGDVNTAEKILSNLHHRTHPDFSIAMSKLIEGLVKQNNLNKACELLDTLLLKDRQQPRAECLKTVWNALIEAKEFDKLRAQSRNLSTSTKHIMRFQKYLNRAALEQYGLDKCLEDFESKLTHSRDDNRHVVTNSLHFTTFLREFKKNPSALARFKPIAERLADQEIFLPINIVWCYYFEENKPEAEDLWSKYITFSQQIVTKHLMNKSKIDNNIDLLERLNEKIWTSQTLTKTVKMKVLSSLVGTYTANKRYEKAIDVLKSNPSFDVEHFNGWYPNILQDLKDGLESSGKRFPFQLQNARQRMHGNPMNLEILAQ